MNQDIWTPNRVALGQDWRVAVAIGAATLLWVALANGFPLLFADSGTYIRIGTELYYPLDRSPIYGLLILPFARAGDVWGVILLQALFTATIIGLVTHRVIGKVGWKTHLAILLGLAMLTSLPWFVGQVMPDLLTSLMALTIFLILFDNGASRMTTLWLPLVLAALAAVHLSNLPLAAGLIVVGTATGLAFGGGRVMLARAARAVVGLLLAVIALCTMNLIVEHQFRPSLASNMFLTARLFDARVGQPILAQACADRKMELCRTLPFVEDPRRLQPGQDYLWDAHTPRAVMARENLDRLNAEEAALIGIALSDHKGTVLRSALDGWIEQLVRTRTGDGLIPYDERMQIARQMRSHFPGEVASWEESRQQAGSIQTLAKLADGWVPVLVAIFSPIMLLVAYRQRQPAFMGLACIILATILGNAAICGALSGPADRYQNRVIWLLPLLGILAAAQWLSRRKAQRTALAIPR